MILFYPSANRDEDVFEAADRLDVNRDPNPHLAFGFGPHFCLGASLARLELRVMFRESLRRLPDLRARGRDPLPYRHSNFITGPEAMPVDVHADGVGAGERDGSRRAAGPRGCPRHHRPLQRRGDRGDLDGLASCFAPDGVLAIVGRDPFVGRDAIRAGLTGTLGREVDDPTPPIAHLHHPGDAPRRRSAPDEVRTTCYFTALTQVGLDHWGRYRDLLVPLDGRWRFARRDVKVDGYAADSLFGPS